MIQQQTANSCVRVSRWCVVQMDSWWVSEVVKCDCILFVRTVQPSLDWDQLDALLRERLLHLSWNRGQMIETTDRSRCPPKFWVTTGMLGCMCELWFAVLLPSSLSKKKDTQCNLFKELLLWNFNRFSTFRITHTCLCILRGRPPPPLLVFAMRVRCPRVRRFHPHRPRFSLSLTIDWGDPWFFYARRQRHIGLQLEAAMKSAFVLTRVPSKRKSSFSCAGSCSLSVSFWESTSNLWIEWCRPDDQIVLPTVESRIVVSWFQSVRLEEMSRSVEVSNRIMMKYVEHQEWHDVRMEMTFYEDAQTTWVFNEIYIMNRDTI